MLFLSEFHFNVTLMFTILDKSCKDLWIIIKLSLKKKAILSMIFRLKEQIVKPKSGSCNYNLIWIHVMLPKVVGMHIRVHNISLRILEGLKLEWTHLLLILVKIITIRILLNRKQHVVLFSDVTSTIFLPNLN